MMRRISGLAGIARQFDGMIIDQFGVIHDGRMLYPHADEVMAELHGAGIKVVIVTNSAKRSAPNTERIVKMGIPRRHFVACISSGDLAYRSLSAKRAFIIGRSGDDYGYDGIEAVADPADAEVMLILGSDAPKTTLDDYRNMLRGMTLPALCCNPDRWMITASGLQPAPGAIAALYEEMGGKVTWIGKPFPDIYRAALAAMDHPKKVLCIGDSAEHDVEGGRRAGLATLLVQQGVSRDLAEDQIRPLPDFLLPAFRWVS